LLLGSNDQLVKAADEASEKGWDSRVARTTYDGENGLHSKEENFGVLNSDNLKNLHGVGADGRLEEYKNMVDKISKVSMHEDGHSKFDDHPKADKGGHVTNTIMDGSPGSVIDPKYDDWMKERLGALHGFIKK
jgi:hypothetical protein